MIRIISICLLTLCTFSCAANHARKPFSSDPDAVPFASSETNLSGTPLTLSGRLLKPAGNGRFPAVVLLHGCGGVQPRRDHRWAERLVGWGYVTLQVDSFGPRDISSVCTLYGRDMTDMLARREVDAYDARQFLAGLPYVDPGRIAVMGWSNGGSTTLNALRAKNSTPFRAAIAMYPSCRAPLAGLNAPLLILIGDKDDWTPAKSCTAMMPPEQTGPEVTLQIFPGAYHAYDTIGKPHQVSGSRGSSHHLEHNPPAEIASIDLVKEFLGKHLQQ